MTPSIDAYLLEGQISSRSDLKRQSFGLSKESRFNDGEEQQEEQDEWQNGINKLQEIL